MSATGRGRRLGGPEDFYATPAWCVHRLLEVFHPTERGTWLEPSAGNGAVIRAVNTVRPGLSWAAVEVRAEERETLEATGARVAMGDFLDPETPFFTDVSVVIGNPPFAQAMAFIERSLTLYQNARVAFLLRLNFAGSEERSDFMRRCPPTVYVLPNRPAFRDGQADSCEYAWFVWPRGDHRERTEGFFRVLAPTSAAERDQKLVARGRRFEVAQGDLFTAQKIQDLGTAPQAASSCRNEDGVDCAAAIPRSENDGKGSRRPDRNATPTRQLETPSRIPCGGAASVEGGSRDQAGRAAATREGSTSELSNPRPEVTTT